MPGFDLDDASRILSGLTTVRLYLEGTKGSPGALSQISDLLAEAKAVSRDSLIRQQSIDYPVDVNELLLSMRLYHEDQISEAFDRVESIIKSQAAKEDASSCLGAERERLARILKIKRRHVVRLKMKDLRAQIRLRVLSSVCAFQFLVIVVLVAILI